jgi:NitT/TauT family transport system ATP-binding protein
VIEVDAISFAFGGQEVLSQLSFFVKKAEVVGILGPSGVGKTTLLRCIAGLLKPQLGQIHIDGISPELARKSQRIGYLFQQDSLLEWRTVEENVMLPFEAAENSDVASEIESKVARSLQLVGLTEVAQKFPAQLSGGMRQRVALARALATDPKTLLLDEPFAAIDLLTREKIMIQMHRILHQAETPTVLVTHHIEEGIFLSDRLLLLGGRPATIVQTWNVKVEGERTEALLSEPSFLKLVLELKQRLRSGGYRA